MCIIELFFPPAPLNSSGYTGKEIEIAEMHRTHEIRLIITACLILCPVCTSAASVIFGAVSWTVLPKWRTFRHYAFMNVLLTNSLGLLLIGPHTPKAVALIGFFINSAFIHWLMVITVMFYIEFVKVFTSMDSINHAYTKANIFGWLLPAGWTLLQALCGEIFHYLFFVMVILNLTVYLNVLCVLCIKCKDQENVFTRVILSTFAFIATGVVWCLPLAIRTGLPCVITVTLFAICYFVTMLSINVFFLMLKVHRELWSEHRLRVKSFKLNEQYFENLPDVIITLSEKTQGPKELISS